MSYETIVMHPPTAQCHAGRCIQRQHNTFKLNYCDLSPIEQCTYTVVYVVVSDASAMSYETIVMYPPIAQCHAGRCIQQQHNTFKLNYCDLSPIVQCTFTVVYVVVSDASAMSYETIVMYPPIAGGYIVVSNVSVRFRDTIVMNPPIAGGYIVVSNISASFHESIVMNRLTVWVLCRCILRQSSDGQFQCFASLSLLTCRPSGSSSVLGGRCFQHLIGWQFKIPFAWISL